jgi:hypothetical protein
MDGAPLFFRRNDNARELAGHPDFIFRMGIALPLNLPNEHGFPSNEEMEQLNIIEDLLAARLEANQLALYVLAITTGGMREYVFYTRNAKTANEFLEEVRKEVVSHELQSYVEEDQNWEVYKQFAH